MILRNVDNDHFLYCIGGMTIDVSINCSSLLKQVIPDEDAKFICADVSGSHFVSKKDIYVQITPFQSENPPLLSDRIFFGEKSALHKTANGYVRTFYADEEGCVPSWQLAIDAQFSQLNYFRCATYPSDEQEAIAVNPCNLAANIFILQHSFINHQGLILHAAGGSILGKGIVFAAPSGFGKSTLSQLLLQHSDHRLFSDERMLVRSVAHNWQIWGTPWQGKACIAKNESAPLSALVFLTQAQEAKIIQLQPSAGLHRLLQVASIPWYSKEWANKGLAVCESLLRDIPAFELAFRPDQSAVEAVEGFASSVL